jgi:hypothetical protein
MNYLHKSRLMRSPSCLCVCLCIPLLNLNSWKNLCETWYVYHGTWAHLNGVIKISLPSVPTLQPLKFLRQNINIAWAPIPIFMKLGTYEYIMPREAISTAYFINPLDQWYQYYSLSPCRGNNRNVTLGPESTVMELGTYIIPPESISTANFINPPLQ